MYAIFRAQGKQFRAETGKTVRLPRMEAEAGSTITFDEVLLASDGDTITAGTPMIKGASVTPKSSGTPRAKRSTSSASSAARTFAARRGTAPSSPMSGSPA